VPADWKVWADYRLTERDFIDVTRLVIFNYDLTRVPITFSLWDAQVKDRMEEWRCQQKESREATRELEKLIETNKERISAFRARNVRGGRH
jgi:hypothetical protein